MKSKHTAHADWPKGLLTGDVTGGTVSPSPKLTVQVLTPSSSESDSLEIGSL